MIFIVWLLPLLVKGANILVLEAVPSPSHHIWLRTLTYALADRGHNITSLSPDIEEDTPRNLHYLHLNKIYEVFYNCSDDMNYVELGKSNAFVKAIVFTKFSMRSLEGIVLSKGYRQLLDYPDSFKFDLIIYDFFLGPLLLPFATKFPDANIIGATAYYSVAFANPMVGGVLTPAFVPYIFYSSDLDTFPERLNNFIFTYFDYFIRTYYINRRIRETLSPDFPRLNDVRDLEKKTKLVLINKDPAFAIQEQSMPNVISVGGLQVQRSNDLSKDISTLLNTAKKGVIVFSFGTNIMGDMIKSERLTEILEAFRAVPDYTILFKIDTEKFSVNLPKNVATRKWLPLNAVLAHPNVKLFVTHCGLLSIQEALWNGVAMLGIPIFADEFDNVRLLVKHGIAEHLDISNIDRYSFRKLIERMLKDPKYTEKARILSQEFRDQKETPLERAIWSTEFVLRHPNTTLMKSSSIDLGIVQRQSWDVLALFCLLILIIFIFIFKICFCILAMFKQNS